MNQSEENGEIVASDINADLRSIYGTGHFESYEVLWKKNCSMKGYWEE